MSTFPSYYFIYFYVFFVICSFGFDVSSFFLLDIQSFGHLDIRAVWLASFATVLCHIVTASRLIAASASALLVAGRSSSQMSKCRALPQVAGRSSSQMSKCHEAPQTPRRSSFVFIVETCRKTTRVRLPKNLANIRGKWRRPVRSG